MSDKKLNHVAIAVRDLEKAKELFGSILNCQASKTINVPDQKVRVCFFELAGAKIELISPMADNKSLNRFLDKKGDGLHHICLGVENVESALEQYRNQDIKLIDQTPRIGAEGNKIAFLHPKSTGGVLIELEEGE